jgi:hypothetical protein
MDTEDRQAVLDRAEALLPKYGGLTIGAVNQAALLLGIPLTADELKQLSSELLTLTLMEGTT